MVDLIGGLPQFGAVGVTRVAPSAIKKEGKLSPEAHAEALNKMFDSKMWGGMCSSKRGYIPLPNSVTIYYAESLTALKGYGQHAIEEGNIGIVVAGSRATFYVPCRGEWRSLHSAYVNEGEDEEYTVDKSSSDNPYNCQFKVGDKIKVKKVGIIYGLDFEDPDEEHEVLRLHSEVLSEEEDDDFGGIENDPEDDRDILIKDSCGLLYWVPAEEFKLAPK